MIRFLLALLCFASAVPAYAAEGLDVTIDAGGVESLYRHAGGDWRETVNGAADFTWLADELALFDVRPGGSPWYSTHDVSGVDLAKLTISVGERDDGFQSFLYGGIGQVRLPVVSIPEPPSYWLGVLSLAGFFVALSFRSIKERKGAYFVKTQTGGSDGADAGTVARGVENAYLGVGRRRVDELRRRGGDSSCGS